MFLFLSVLSPLRLSFPLLLTGYYLTVCVCVMNALPTIHVAVGAAKTRTIRKAVAENINNLGHRPRHIATTTTTQQHHTESNFHRH
uniref:Uncharacterized protein n=1 Tax=Octopus bimaculoides TaxID=37653 RepID=A0A0L8FRL9_OCTBM